MYAAPGAPVGGRTMAPDAVLSASAYLGPDPHRALGCEHERARCLLAERVYGVSWEGTPLHRPHSGSR